MDITEDVESMYESLLKEMTKEDAAKTVMDHFVELSFHWIDIINIILGVENRKRGGYGKL